MLDAVPLAGPGRQMADRDLKARLLREGLQLDLPQPQAVAVGAAAVSGDLQAPGVGVALVRVMLRTAELLPPTGLSTLGFDPTRFQAKPPACYRASWQLLGRDSHPLATTSLCWISYSISTSNSGRTQDPG
jgi:hypothetical protein